MTQRSVASTVRVLAGTLAAGVAAALVTALAPAAQAVVTTTADPVALAAALTGPGASVTGASFVTLPPTGNPHAVSTTALTSFPTQGADYAILTTGDAALADQPNLNPGDGVALGGLAVRGDTDQDVSVLKVDLQVPPTANCLRIDFQFLSEEFPEFVGSSFNDAFIAELDTTDWATAGSAITAPHNFAFDPVGNPVTINAAGVTSMTADAALGTTYDGATPLLSAAQTVTPGAHSLYLSIFDQGDQILDSAVFLDNLVVGSVPDPATQCKAGAQPKTFGLTVEPPTATQAVGGTHTVTATLNDLSGAAPAPVNAGTLLFSVAGANPTSGTASTDVAGTATFTYTGAAAGDDAISVCYDVNGNAACDAGEPTASATATWTPVAVNNAPVADAQSVTTGQDTPVAITLTAADADNDPLTYAVATGPANGTLTGTAPALTYTPAPGFFGTDSFTFTANDGQATSAPATVSITVTKANAAPVANAQSVTTGQDTPVAITLTAADADNDPLTYVVATGPANGTLTGTAPALTYTPAPGFSGTDSFTFTANDGQATSAPATVSITVTPKQVVHVGSLVIREEDRKPYGYSSGLSTVTYLPGPAKPTSISVVSAPGQKPIVLSLTRSKKVDKNGPVYTGSLTFERNGKTIKASVKASWDAGTLTVTGKWQKYPLEGMFILVIDPPTTAAAPYPAGPLKAV